MSATFICCEIYINSIREEESVSIDEENIPEFEAFEASESESEEET